MSFNHLEVKQAVEIISKALTKDPSAHVVKYVDLVEFPLPVQVSDLNLRIGFTNGFALTLSLKNPWVGLFYLRSSEWKRAEKQAWKTLFGEAGHKLLLLEEKTLNKIEVPPGERTVTFYFLDSVLEVDLFPSRPNWRLKTKEGEYQWRETLGKARPSLGDKTGPSPQHDLAVRNFEDSYSYYLEARKKSLLQGLLSQARSQTEARIARLAKTRMQMKASLEESHKADEVKKEAENLKATLYQYSKSQQSEKVKELTTLFQKYKKLSRTRIDLEVRLQGIEKEFSEATSVRNALLGLKIEETPFEVMLEKLRKFLKPEEEIKRPQKNQEKKQEKKWSKSGIRKFTSKEGLLIWVGQNHKENEELVIRLARGNDVWLHLKNRPGAHVVVQLQKGKTASLETLLDAATLVAHYSDIPKQTKVEVDYTFRKNVKRVAGGSKKSDQFLVTYSQNKTLVVAIDPSRLSRLLSIWNKSEG